MKMQTIDLNTKKPLSNLKAQIQVKGKDSGYLTINTDGQGYFSLDDKYNGQQIAYYLGGSAGQWTTANNGGTLYIDSKKTTQGSDRGDRSERGDRGDKQRQTTTHSSDK